MSGGSFDYLCYKYLDGSPSDYMLPDELANMSEFLLTSDYKKCLVSDEIGHEILEVAQKLQALQEEARKIVKEYPLFAVLHAVEWWVSNDVCEDDVIIAYEEYKQKKVAK